MNEKHLQRKLDELRAELESDKEDKRKAIAELFKLQDETDQLRVELEQVSGDRYKAATELASLRDENEQLKVAVQFELDNLRRVVEGLEGAL